MSIGAAIGRYAIGESAITPPSIAAVASLGLDPTTRPVLLVDIELTAPATGAGTVVRAIGARAIGAFTLVPTMAAGTETIRASDIGYASRGTDVGGTVGWPATLARALEVERRVDLAPNGTGAGAGWGVVRLIDDGRYAGLAGARNPDGRTVRIRLGAKIWDQARLMHVEPPLGSFVDVLVGVGRNWSFEDQSVVIPLRDPTYWLERPLQANVYAGTGGMEGIAALAGRGKPKARGGTALDPIREVAPVCIDPTNRIYQYNDGPGTVVALYEAGRAVFTFAGDTTDLWSGSTPAGQYRTDDADGLFQLGSTPVGDITADVTGRFPVAGTVTGASEIARYLMTEDLALPGQLVDDTAFATVAAATGWPAGWYWDGADPVDGAEAAGLFFRSVGARLVATRAGRLRPVLIREPTASPVARLDRAQIVGCRPVAFPVDPPARRLRVAGRRIHTARTSGLSAALTDARRAELAQEWRFETVTYGAVDVAYRRPSDPDPVQTALLRTADMAALASLLGAVYGTRRRLFALDLPVAVALRREVGDVVQVEFPLDDLAAGRPGLVVGETIRWAEQVGTLLVMV